MYTGSHLEMVDQNCVLSRSKHGRGGANLCLSSPFEVLFKEIESLVQKNGFRVSFHPNQFTLFTSQQEHITTNAIIDMTYHYQMLEAMDLHRDATINFHVRGVYGNKEEAIDRFRENFAKLDKDIRMQTTLENDETYTGINSFGRRIKN